MFIQRICLMFYADATYLAVPLEEAKENAACNCDWAAV